MQNYQNHKRYYVLHHLIVYPLNLVLIVWSFVNLFNQSECICNRLFWVVLSITVLLMSVILRLYALKNQDRTIRLELRQRFFELTGKSFSSYESQLKMGQIIGLRFAGDDELEALVNRSISEKLSNNEIKLAIKNWKADEFRI